MDVDQARVQARAALPEGQQNFRVRLTHRSEQRFIFAAEPAGDEPFFGGNHIVVDRTSGQAELTIMPMLLPLLDSMEEVTDD